MQYLLTQKEHDAYAMLWLASSELIEAADGVIGDTVRLDKNGPILAELRAAVELVNIHVGAEAER